MVIRVNTFETEVMVEFYSKSLVRVNGNEIELEHQLKPIKVNANGFVCKQTAVFVVCINNIEQ